MMLRPLLEMLSTVTWLIAGVLFLIGVMSFLRAKQAAPKTVTPLHPEAAHIQPNVSHSNPSLSQLDRTWDDMKQGRAASNSGSLGTSNAWEAPAAYAKPNSWSLELLRDLEWKRFEDVCQRFYEIKGIKSETTPLGPDGGIDIRLYQDDSGTATSIVQCKAWGGRSVGIKPVRELLGVMTHAKIEKAFFMASCDFTDEAKAFANSNRIILISGETLVALIKRLSEGEQQALLEFATDGDFSTPTCPTCGIKMRQVSGNNGRSDFWGCRSYPRCRRTLPMRIHRACLS